MVFKLKDKRESADILQMPGGNIDIFY